jgi:2-methylisocitrate lyase-like PEP mutase family enzyme
MGAVTESHDTFRDLFKSRSGVFAPLVLNPLMARYAVDSGAPLFAISHAMRHAYAALHDGRVDPTTGGSVQEEEKGDTRCRWFGRPSRN